MLKIGILGIFLFLPSCAWSAHYPGFSEGPLAPGLEWFRIDQSAPKSAPRWEWAQLPGMDAARRSSPADIPAAVPNFEFLGENLRDAVASPPTLEWFLEAIRQPGEGQRIEAMENFAYSGNFAAIPYVSAVLLRLNEAVPVRVAAARALGAIGDGRACAFLAQALKDPDARVRFQAALALGEIKTGRVASILARCLGDPEPVVRAAAALTLGRLGVSATILELMSQALKSEPDQGVRSILTWSLGRVRSN
jgi:HEAT repeat protein